MAVWLQKTQTQVEILSKPKIHKKRSINISYLLIEKIKLLKRSSNPKIALLMVHVQVTVIVFQWKKNQMEILIHKNLNSIANAMMDFLVKDAQFWWINNSKCKIFNLRFCKI